MLVSELHDAISRMMCIQDRCGSLSLSCRRKYGECQVMSMVVAVMVRSVLDAAYSEVHVQDVCIDLVLKFLVVSKIV